MIEFKMKTKTIKCTFNKTIVYDAETHSMYKKQSNDAHVNLAISASLCLQKLLEDNDRIVSHSELLACVWGARGMNVSSNTLYQNISILRKSFSELGIEKEIIKTVPKRGFIITSANIEFEKESDDTVNDTAIRKSNFSNSKSKDKFRSHMLSFKYLPFTLLLIAICIISYEVFHSSYFSIVPHYNPVKYKSFSEFNGCHLFRNSSLRGDDFFKEIISSHKLECSSEKWWYFTNSPPDLEVSLIRCSAKLDQNTDNDKLLCVSDFYLIGDI